MTRARFFSLLLLLGAAGLVALNVMAWRHVRAMLNFVEASERTPAPEDLSTGQKIRTLFSGVRIPRPANHALPSDFGLNAETIHIKSSESMTLECWMTPVRRSKGVVILFHGYADCKATLLPNAKAFADLGYSPLLVDFRGSGGSTGNGTTIGFRESQDVAAVYHYVRSTQPHQPILLFGQSMGAAAILRALDQHRLRPAAVIIESCFDRLVTTVGHRFQAMGLPAFPFAHLLVFWGGIQIGGSGFDHNPADYARNATVPVLVLHGSGDPRVRSEEAESIYNHLAGPKQFILLPDVGHESYIVREPAAWNQAIKAFLASLDARTAAPTAP